MSAADIINSYFSVDGHQVSVYGSGYTFLNYGNGCVEFLAVNLEDTDQILVVCLGIGILFSEIRKNGKATLYEKPWTKKILDRAEISYRSDGDIINENGQQQLVIEGQIPDIIHLGLLFDQKGIP